MHHLLLYKRMFGLDHIYFSLLSDVSTDVDMNFNIYVLHHVDSVCWLHIHAHTLQLAKVKIAACMYVHVYCACTYCCIENISNYIHANNAYAIIVLLYVLISQYFNTFLLVFFFSFTLLLFGIFK